MLNSSDQTKYQRRKGDRDRPSEFRSLQLLNSYRLAIACMLVSFIFIDETFIEQNSFKNIFLILSLFYITFSVAAISISSKRLVDLRFQVHTNVIIDVIAIACFTLFTGGVNGGLGTLLIAPIAGAALLLPGRTAFLFASYGTVAIISQEFYGDFSGILDRTAYSQAGILGIAQFATAILAVVLAQRASVSAALAEKRGIDLANLGQLNQHLINRIEAGIIVVDDDQTIKLMNQSALKLLNIPKSPNDIALKDISKNLLTIFETWQRDSKLNPSNVDTFDLEHNNQLLLRIKLSKVGARAEDRGTVIYLYDNTELNQQIQQSKLASLGRLTASIAHEIRNPLGAISHAAQLLEESTELNDADKRLADIIHLQSNRLNTVVQNVLRLSRKDDIAPEPLELGPWLNQFSKEFSEANKLTSNWCEIYTTPDSLTVLFDSQHLHQVLWNLCSNALKYAINSKDQTSQINIKAYLDKNKQFTFLDIIDQGPGIAKNEQDKLFEPFYTTSTTGTGLGLYISRELCLSNGSDLSYVDTVNDGSCFRLTLRMPE